MTKHVLIQVTRDLELDCNHLRDTGKPVTVKNLAAYVSSRLTARNVEFVSFTKEGGSYFLDYRVHLLEPEQDGWLGRYNGIVEARLYEIASRLDRDLQHSRDEQGFLEIDIIEVCVLEGRYPWDYLVQNYALTTPVIDQATFAITPEDLLERTVIQFGSFAIIESEKDDLFDILKVGDEGGYTVMDDAVRYEIAEEMARELAEGEEHDVGASQVGSPKP